MIRTIDFVAWPTFHYRDETGFILSKDYWRKGLIVEAVSKVIKFKFENMEVNKIEASCMVENTQSQRVLQKLGVTCHK
ncbi:GNAT family N-acetyltransferase [Oceanobacillus oncorhynchi]|uniref:GNAT family N-acetyltransferase n=1 Tax=Oceanobacillus oncorhynchi TaxID=545501 RepID=UPI0034D3AD2C